MTMKIVRWQPYMNHHQYYLWEEVSNLVGTDVLFVLSKDLVVARRNQGWKPWRLDGIPHLFLRSVSQGIQIIRDNPNSIHVFQSFFGLNKIYFIPILFSLFKGEKVVVTAEPYTTDAVGYSRNEIKIISTVKKVLRPILYKSLNAITRLVSKESNLCILAISEMAQKQFLENGFPKNIIFPFGYFIPPDLPVFTNEKTNSNKLKLIFLGSLLKRKGLDILLSAMELLDEDILVELDIYGTGNFKRFIKNRKKIAVQYKGSITPSRVQQTISKYDVLVLPSRHDGWGVVVNEALLQEVPVIVSDKVGASCLVKASGAGVVFRSGDLNDLVANLQQLLSDTTKLSEIKRYATTFDKNEISPATGANYFVELMAYFFYGEGKMPRLFWDETR